MENNNNPKIELLDIRGLIVKYLKKWYWFVISVFVCVVIAGFHIISTVPTYKVQTSILIRQNNSNAFSPATLFENINVNLFYKVVDDEMEILRSRELMRNIITKLDLQSNFYEKGRFTYRDVYPNKPIEVTLPEMFIDTMKQNVEIIIKPSGMNYKVQVNYGKIKENYELSGLGKSLQTHIGTIDFDKGEKFNTKQPRAYKITFSPIENAITAYCKSMSVTVLSKKNNIINITTVAQNTEKAEDMLNEMVNIYNNNALMDKNAIALTSRDLIAERIGYFENELLDIENQIENYRKDNKLTDIYLEMQNSLDNSSEYDKRINDTETQLGIVNYVLETINKNHFEIIPDIEFPASSASSSKRRESSHSESVSLPLNLIREYNSNLIEHQRLLKFSSDDKTALQEVEQQLNMLRSAIMVSLDGLRKGLDISLKDLKNKNSEYMSKIVQLPSQDRKLNEIRRQQAVKQGLYTFLLQKYEENAIALESIFPSSKLLNAANVSPTPESPKKFIIAFVALMIGLLLPIIAIYVLDILNNKIVDIKQFARKAKLPVLAEVKQYKGKTPLLISDKKSPDFLETFRALRTNILLSDNPSQTILVTSGIKGEGKTTVAANLALAFAMLEKKTVLIDFDLRQNSIAKYFDLRETRGVTHYLRNSHTLSDITVQSNILPNLDIIPCGTIPENPTELLANKKLDELFSELKQKYEYIILDSSPISLFSDTYLLNSHIDSTVYVLRYNYSPTSAADLIAEIENNKKLKNISLVFNEIENDKFFNK
jgi:capsular exopolysaccharide family